MYTQKTFPPSRHNIIHFILTPQLKRFVGQSFYLGSLLALSVYAWVRLLFHDFPFEPAEETVFILQILLTGWALAATCIGVFNLLLLIADKYSQLYKKLTCKRSHLRGSMPRKWIKSSSIKITRHGEGRSHAGILPGENVNVYW